MMLWFAYISPIIHPIWLIEEKAIIDRKLDWFIPITPPTKAFADAIRRRYLLNESCLNSIDIIERGAIFCHVTRSMQVVHEELIITEGNQKWHGNLPNFKVIEDKSRIQIRCFIDVYEYHKPILENNNIEDPRAWAKKYFIAASVSWDNDDLKIKGINLSMFNSIATHTISHLDLEIAISVLRSKVDIETIEVDVIFIRVRRGWTPKQKLEASDWSDLTLICSI